MANIFVLTDSNTHREQQYAVCASCNAFVHLNFIFCIVLVPSVLHNMGYKGYTVVATFTKLLLAVL